MRYKKNNGNSFVNKDGILYFSSPMLTDAAINKRFLKCLGEVLEANPQNEVADIIGTHSSYLTLLKTSKTPKVPALTIARFCDVFGYSPAYILLGQGEKTGGAPPTVEQQKEILHLEIIQKLVNALLTGDLDKETRKMAREVLSKR